MGDLAGLILVWFVLTLLMIVINSILITRYLETTQETLAN